MDYFPFEHLCPLRNNQVVASVNPKERGRLTEGSLSVIGECAVAGGEVALRIEHAAREPIGLQQNSGQFAEIYLARTVLDGPLKAGNPRSQHDQV
jgi:hypothetical protein